MDETTNSPAPSEARALSLVDTTSIIVGIIIGAVVFQSAADIAGALPNLGWLLAAWFAGGVIAWVGALCYAEWATRCPDGGGDYHYLRRAFGPRVAWVFGWMQLLVIRPGSVGFFALALGNSAQQLCPLAIPYPRLCYSILAVTLSTLVNLCGLREGLWAQRILTSAKVLGLLLVSIIGCLVAILGNVRPLEHDAPLTAAYTPAVAMIIILYAYGGWNEVGYLGGEIRSARRTIPRTMGWGLAVVAGLYMLLNLAYVLGLGWERFIRSSSPAAEILAIPFGDAGETAMHLLLAVTLFGALHGSLLTGARLTAAFVGDTLRGNAALCAKLERAGHPAWLAYAIEYGITVAALLLVGYEENPNALIIFASPPFWLGLLLVGWGLIIVRRRDKTPADDPAIFRMPLYPGSVVFFVATCGWLTWSSCDYAHDKLTNVAWGVGAVLSAGIGLSFFLTKTKP
jgi:amino acid transporter